MLTAVKCENRLDKRASGQSQRSH